jgi:hypothetical protein
MRGSQKGEHRGGRKPGVPNRATVERQERQRLEEKAKQAETVLSVAERAHIKLAKDVLEDYMMAFGTIAAIYQNRVAAKMNAKEEAEPEDLDGFEKWGGLTVTTARALADFQSPKFRAINVHLPPPEPVHRPGDDAKVIDIDLHDPNATARVYRNVMKIGRRA